MHLFEALIKDDFQASLKEKKSPLLTHIEAHSPPTSTDISFADKQQNFVPVSRY